MLDVECHRLNARVKTLEEALRSALFGGHRALCAVWERSPCDCGKRSSEERALAGEEETDE